jgi:hypothetical protein
MHFFLPFLVPLWMIAYPVACYLFQEGRMVPTEEVRTYMYESSGPWSHDVCIVFILSLLVAIVLHGGFLFYTVTWRKWREAKVWLLGSATGIATTALSLYWFGNLMDI